MPLTRTPLRYPGGKSKYAKIFANVVSLNGLKKCTFVEVYAGGAGAAITLLLKGHVRALFLNDLDVAIYSFWKSVKEKPTDLIGLIRNTPVSLAEWRRQKAIYDRKDATNPLALGFAAFFLNRCNRSGILDARPIGGMKQNGNYRIDARYNRATSIAKIEAIAQHATNIDVFNMDGVAFLKQLKRRHRKRRFLVYLDPPYFQKGPDLYLNHFSEQDHEALRDNVIKCPFPWVLSYDNHRTIVDMYRPFDCKLYRNRIRHTITGSAYAEELVISKLELPDSLEQLEFNYGR